MSVSTGRLPAEAAPAARLRLGIALVFCCAFGYATLPTLARLAYDGGGDPMTVTVFRAGAAAALYAVLCLGRRVPMLPPHGLRLPAALVGLIWLVGSYCYVTSIRYIPIGLAVTIFYLFPMIVAMIARVVDGEALPPSRLAALALGFAGVALAVGVSFGDIAPLGIGLALVSAVGLSINITVNARVMRRASPLTAMAAMTGTSALALVVVAPAVGMALPTTALGWFGVLGGAAIFCFSTSLFYVGISLIGGVRAAMVCNIEPVLATFLAYLVLGEALRPHQLAGVTLVIAAILLMQKDRTGR
ncbi:MAG: DMT family transporter [Alphaproteobacteria bacterium]|nr:DMT family transporter [Alphaproteobacteria bacterium]